MTAQKCATEVTSMSIQHELVHHEMKQVHIFTNDKWSVDVPNTRASQDQSSETGATTIDNQARTTTSGCSSLSRSRKRRRWARLERGPNGWTHQPSAKQSSAVGGSGPARPGPTPFDFRHHVSLPRNCPQAGSRHRIHYRLKSTHHRFQTERDANKVELQPHQRTNKSSCQYFM